MYDNASSALDVRRAADRLFFCKFNHRVRYRNFMLTLVNRCSYVYRCGTLFTSPLALSVVFCLFFVAVCLVLLSLVAAAFLANKDVYKNVAQLNADDC